MLEEDVVEGRRGDAERGRADAVLVKRRDDIGDYLTRGLPAQAMNFGGSYRLTQTQQIDFHAGFGMNRNSPDYFIGVGYSLRFDGLW